MKVSRKHPLFFIFVFAVMAIAFYVAATPVQADGDPWMPADFTLHGKNGDQWNAEWWQWAYGIPAATHPINQEGNVDCSAYQRGRVWMLGGTFNGGDDNVRNCTVPTDTYLWFPVMNYVDWRPGDFVTDQEGHEHADFFGDHMVNLVVTVDGVTVPNIGDYRYHSDVFPFHIQPGGISEGDPTNTAYPHLIPRLQYDGIADGYYIMLKPLSEGPHTIYFTGTYDFCGGPCPPLVMTYNLTVVARGNQ